MQLERTKVSYDEFLRLNQADERLEYIDGEVYLLASPTVEHQRTLLNIAFVFKTYFNRKSCEPFIAPLDVILRNEEDVAPHHVQPDIMVICDKDGLRDNEYTGIPSLIVEIVSPTNSPHDRIKKFNLYMRFGVKEYWLVHPKFKTVEVNVLNKDGLYEQSGIYKGVDIVYSQMFSDLEVDLKEVFS